MIAACLDECIKSQRVFKSVYRYGSIFESCQIAEVIEREVSIKANQNELCPSCQKFHFISYAFDDKSKKKHIFRDAYKKKYIQYSNETNFETGVFKNLIASILFNHASFRGFAQAYNYRHANIDFTRTKLNAKRLTDVFYTYELNKYYSEFRNE